MRRGLVVAALALVGAAGFGCGDDDGLTLVPVDLAVPKEMPPDLAAPVDDGGDAAEVAVGPGGQDAFNPQTAFVNAGGSVTWRWVSGVHSVVADALADGRPGFPSSPEQSGGDYTAHFSHAGQFGYHCGVANHTETGVVIVQ